jgi:crotonobetainyl-CoA:carnitine CoA-transferase CaiB-like acyl-CoA transferase
VTDSAASDQSPLPLDGLRVVTTANALPAAVVGQVLADSGAEVWLLEPPTGSRLRTQAAWKFWGRGQHSLRVDLTTEAGHEQARALIARADVFVDGWGTGVAARLGLAADDLVAANPRLVHTRISAFGDESTWAGVTGWEPVVTAVIGANSSLETLAQRAGPAFISTPFCSVSAAHLALQGILGALVERERSCVGQQVEVTLAQAFLVYDTWNWLLEVLAKRYESAFTSVPPYDYDRLVPNTPFFFRLMAGLSKDGKWLQFSQTTDRLWFAFLRSCGLDPDDPEVRDAPDSEDDDVRVAFWEKLLAAVRTRTVDEWMDLFDHDPDVWADQFRSGPSTLEHPQLVADERVIFSDTGVRMAAELAQASAWPRLTYRPPPALGADNDLAAKVVAEALPTDAPATAAALSDAPALDGITILEFGTFFAAPFGATLLAEQGARVIKIEAPDGDSIRNIIPFPELAGVKALHGKESVVLDTAAPESRAVLDALVRKADVVLQGFRAGVADRMGVNAEDLLAINPDLVYVIAPGYSDGPPFGRKPAFAPTMGAASGLAVRNIGGAPSVPTGPDLPLDVVKRTGMRLAAGAMGSANADGFAALGVGTSMLLGILGHARHGGGNVLRTSMLSTMAAALADTNVAGPGTPTATPDDQLLGLGPLHRLYETADGWVMLVVLDDPDARAALSAATGIDLEGADLVAVDAAEQLEALFRTAPAQEWQERLLAVGVPCVVAEAEHTDKRVVLGDFGVEHGYTTTGVHQVLDEYPRPNEYTKFSRSRSVLREAPLCGQHTDAVLAELGLA